MSPIAAAAGPPECFARLEKVFPLNPRDGLRHSPPECQACPHKVACLRAALASPQGAAVPRGGAAGGGLGRMIRGLRRWSALKAARQGEAQVKVKA